MTPEEIIDLLTVAAAYDQRTTGPGDVAAWHAVLGDVSFTRAREAVIAHYRENSRRVMPADIRQHARNATRPERTPVAELTAGVPDEPNRDYLTARDQMIDALAARDARAVGPDPSLSGERAAAWISAHTGPGKYVPPSNIVPLPQWAALPDDPPELRAELLGRRLAIAEAARGES
jgi:hypothetical protein